MSGRMGDACGDQGAHRARLHLVDIVSPLPGLGPAAATGLRSHGTRGGLRQLQVLQGSCRPVPSEPPAGRLVLDTVVAGKRLHWAAACAGGGWRLRVPQMADFDIDARLRQVTVHRAPGTGDDELALLLRGLVLAFVIALAGDCVLHASAVLVDGAGAIAFAGPSGAGKSTLAAAACAVGAGFVSDDLLRVELGRSPTWLGTAGELRLRPGAEPVARMLRGTTEVGVSPRDRSTDGRLRPGRPVSWPARCTPDGRIGLSPPASGHDRGPLLAVVLPRPVARGPVKVTGLEPAEVVLRLVTAHRIVHWVDPSMLELQLHHAVALASSVPVLAVDVPWGDRVDPEIGQGVVDALLAAVGAGRQVACPHGSTRSGEHVG